MWMIDKPRMGGKRTFTSIGDIQDFSYLQPTKDDMSSKSLPIVAPLTGMLFDFMEPAEEQENVIDIHLVVAQMRLGGCNLSERRSPTCFSICQAGREIRIKMNRRVRSDPS